MQKKACGFSSATKGKFFSALQYERRQEERKNCEKLKPIEKKKVFYFTASFIPRVVYCNLHKYIAY